MGCHSSKPDSVGTPGLHHMRAPMADDHLPDDLASELVQHTVVIDINDIFEFHEELGKGSFGRVVRATNRKSGKVWAVKIVDLGNALDKSSLLNEISIVKRLQHPNIVRMIASYEDAKHMYMVMQLLPGHELFDHLYKSDKTFSEADVRKLVLCLLRAVAYLHSNQITHRDLKLENLLLENELQMTSLKLCDFGLSKFMQKASGFKNYVAPEVLDGDYNEKCDLWSIGVLCYELLTHKSPFHGATTDETMGKIFDGIQPSFFQGDAWKAISPDCINFIKSLMQDDPDERLSAEQALNHRWMRTSASGVIDENKRQLFMKMVSFGKGQNKLKKTAMLSMAMGVGEAHCKPEIVAEVFHSMDLDKNGTLNATEFCKALEDYGLGHDEAMDAFARMDQSKRGKINYIEFVAAVLDEFGEETMKEAFSMLDAEKTGRISVVGLQSVFKNIQACDLQEMVQSADIKGDGTVDYEEFKMMFQSTPARLDQASPPLLSPSELRLDEASNCFRSSRTRMSRRPR
ncbi:CAMK/CDPK protein kinase [Saprolegnia parasitica CBS 223.65]|uniref:non-specific serine/threonine protein kinase n=1 Tax=Saprolegnia parasitica (strain CBS 223.65) TaxID=695850 RepID=A0A067D475_SAPPC|nr:CAMK/CDPK protein kinase [Saprolegnia parasitica CBS 223.65]KDO33822.1 CAMK/CDPK protein kinase [Saprolegnia parasitica CBS 223.65]|eukprot:XP_012195458.1 CAMK/CDPK protein kinase [Saprolegnia parasitica CBS 223.65]